MAGQLMGDAFHALLRTSTVTDLDRDVIKNDHRLTSLRFF